jgi:sulfatase modifying factor 1
MPSPVPPQTPDDEQKSALVEAIIRGKLTPQQARERHNLSSSDLKDWIRIYRREARRAFDDRVKTALSTQGMDVDDLSSAEFSGNIEEMAIAELVQTIEFGRKDAEIRIEHQGELSRIWCVQGEVIDAETGQLVGAPAVYRLLALERGRVQADFAPVQRTRSILLSTQTLLMESARRFDECRQLQKRIGDGGRVYVPSPRSLAPDVQASSDEFAVLRLFDGIRNLDEVIRVSHLPDLETLTHVWQLLRQGLLEHLRSSRSSMEAPQPVTASTQTPELSFLPLAASLGARAEPANAPRRWVWGVAALGSATLGAAFALRLEDARESNLRAAARASAAARAPIQVTAASVLPALLPCPDGTASVGGAGKDEKSASSPVPAGPGASQIAPLGRVCMAKHEVTVQEYEACQAAGACEPASQKPEPPAAALSSAVRKQGESAFASQCNSGQPGRERHPINCVSFTQAQRFCAWRGGRLPTLAEWELAARGREQRAFPWGNVQPGSAQLNACGTECQAWYARSGLASLFESVMYEADDGHVGTAPVGSFPAGSSPEGILDLLGNVAEWTSERVDSADPSSGQASAGRVDAAPSYAVMGGAFSSGASALGSSAPRLYSSPGTQAPDVGFRCVFGAGHSTSPPR